MCILLLLVQCSINVSQSTGIGSVLGPFALLVLFISWEEY